MIPREGGKPQPAAIADLQGLEALRLVLETVVMVVGLGVFEIGVLGVIRLGMNGPGVNDLGVGNRTLLRESRDGKRQGYEDCRDDLLHGPNVARSQTQR